MWVEKCGGIVERCVGVEKWDGGLRGGGVGDQEVVLGVERVRG